MQWFSDNAVALAGLGGLATVIAAVVAVATLMRAGLDSASRTRPYVVAEYRVPERSFRTMTLVVRNAGPTAARNVRVAFDPPFADTDAHGRLSGFVARRYAQPISVLGPGQELTSVVTVDTKNEEGSDAPVELTATVRYDSPWWRVREYKDTFVLQRVIYEQQVFSSSSDSVRGRLKTINEAVQKIEKHLGRSDRALAGIASAIADASMLVAAPREGVVWRVRHIVGDTYGLENIGNTSAFDVTISATSRGFVQATSPDSGAEVPPGGRFDLLASRTLASGTPGVRVEWRTGADATINESIELQIPLA